MKTVAFMRRDPGTAAQVEALLGLPDDQWESISLNLTTDEFARVTVVMFVSRDQAVGLAGLLTTLGDADAG